MAEGINSLGGISSDENNTESNKAAASFVSHTFPLIILITGTVISVETELSRPVIED
ncbi:hypothetical protein ES705_41687 [subsurface metagenome]